MPRFFDSHKLTPEQKARWDSAIEAYGRVQEANLERQVAGMSIQDKKDLMDNFPHLCAHADNLDLDVMNVLRSFSRFSGGGAGDCKSALFARLLEGQPALTEPPPTAFSYPWYAVIEESGPFHVMLGGAQSMGAVMNGARGAEGEFGIGIGINQCTWAVESMNDSARRLFQLQDALAATAKPEKQGSFHSLYEWSPSLLNDVRSAYVARPEIVVCHGSWPSYRLSLGRNETTGQRRYFKEPVLPASLTHAGSVFDLSYLKLNLSIGDVVSHGEHPRVRLEKAQARHAARQKETEGGGYPGLDRVMLDQQVASLDADVAEFEQDPDGRDFVKATYDDWFLVRMPS